MDMGWLSEVYAQIRWPPHVVEREGVEPSSLIS